MLNTLEELVDEFSEYQFSGVVDGFSSQLLVSTTTLIYTYVHPIYTPYITPETLSPFYTKPIYKPPSISELN